MSKLLGLQRLFCLVQKRCSAYSRDAKSPRLLGHGDLLKGLHFCLGGVAKQPRGRRLITSATSRMGCSLPLPR
ncbi:hypothetical protein [Ramlibacter montanisoli]|uniref:hypothetical protein n=1 Tax=Ramlibacter montanisoli TaxID=2732512 RepID=UPI00209BCD5E|nr:hypothetical protein [Ramlibacter montanisoli]